MTDQRLPKGWHLNRVHDVIAHYDNQTEKEAIEEMDRGFDLIDEQNGVRF